MHTTLIAGTSAGGGAGGGGRLGGRVVALQVSHGSTSAIPMENPYCSCKLTRALGLLRSYDAIVIDVDTKDASLGMSCPPVRVVAFYHSPPIPQHCPDRDFLKTGSRGATFSAS